MAKTKASKPITRKPSKAKRDADTERATSELTATFQKHAGELASDAPIAEDWSGDDE